MKLSPPAGLLLLVGLILPAPAAAEVGSDQARLYLSWHAPWGQPGATQDLTLAPGDTTLEDTLFLVCDPGTDSKTFNGFTSTLYFRAAAGDTLGPYWNFGRGSDELRRIRAVFEGDTVHGLVTPWSRGGGFGALHYTPSAGAGTLQMIFAVPPQRTGSVAFGKRYLFARLLFQRPPRDLPGAGQPVCIEWSKASVALQYGYEPVVRRGDRYASVNSSAGAVCGEHRRGVAPPVWKPKTR